MNWPRNEESLEERRRRWRDRYGSSDEAAGIRTTGEFTPFRQIDDVFTRAFWDDSVRSSDSDAFFASYREGFSERRGDGSGRKDFALRNASWLVSDLITDRHADLGRREGFQAAISDDTPVMPERVTVDDPARRHRKSSWLHDFSARVCAESRITTSAGPTSRAWMSGISRKLRPVFPRILKA